MKRFLVFLLFFLMIIIPARTPANPMPATSHSNTATKKPTPVPVENTQVLSPALTATCEPTPLPEDAQNSDHTTYQFNISLNYREHSLVVSEIIDYTNNTGETLSYLPLLVPPAYSEGAFQLDSLQMDSAHQHSTTRLEEGILHIQPNPALGVSEKLELSLIFHLTPTQKNSTFGYTERQLLLADWYPFIPPYLDGQGWLLNPPGAVGEYLSYPLSHFSVNLMISPPDKSLIVAASAPLESHDGNCYRYTAKDVRNFSLGISPEYQVSSSENDSVDIQVYTFPEHASKGQRAAALALRTWETYTNLYGGNPRGFMSIIEADIHDGLECDGLFYLSDWYFKNAGDSPKNYFETLIVHETSHQWFYGMVHNDQANEPWLDEALATYSELLYLESHHPELTDWWWDFRVNAYSPSGYVNSTIYDYVEYRPYINAVYLNGVRFLHELRQAMGDRAFKAFLHAYAQSGQDHHDSSSFFSLLTKFSDIDTSPIVTKYFK